jgi:hypothetical protein
MQIHLPHLFVKLGANLFVQPTFEYVVFYDFVCLFEPHLFLSRESLCEFGQSVCVQTHQQKLFFDEFLTSFLLLGQKL